MSASTARISVDAGEVAASTMAVPTVLSCSHRWASPKFRAEAACFASRPASSRDSRPRTCASAPLAWTSSLAFSARVNTDRIRLRSSRMPRASLLSALMTMLASTMRFTAPSRRNHGSDPGSSRAAVMHTPRTTMADTSGGNSVRGTRSRTSSASATMALRAESEVSSFRSLMPTRSKCSHRLVRSRVRAAKIAEWSLRRLA